MLCNYYTQIMLYPYFLNAIFFDKCDMQKKDPSINIDEPFFYKILGLFPKTLYSQYSS